MSAPISNWDSLAQAVRATACASDLSMRTKEVVKSKVAAVHLARGSLGAAQIAKILGITRRSVNRLLQMPVESTYLNAIDGQIRLRQPLVHPCPFGTDENDLTINP